MRWFHATRRVGGSAYRHPLIALAVVALVLHACDEIDKPVPVCQRPNDLQACP